MRNAMTWIMAALWLVYGGSGQAAERLAVLELSGSQLSAEELGMLTDAVRGGIVGELKAANVAVMTRENMEVMLTDMGLDAGCVAEGACEVETARNLGVDYVISGGMVKMSGVLVTALKLHETKGGTLVASQQVRGKDALELMDALPGAAKILVGEFSGPAPAAVRAQSPVTPTPFATPANASLTPAKIKIMCGGWDFNQIFCGGGGNTCYDEILAAGAAMGLGPGRAKELHYALLQPPHYFTSVQQLASSIRSPKLSATLQAECVKQ